MPLGFGYLNARGEVVLEEDPSVSVAREVAAAERMKECSDSDHGSAVDLPPREKPRLSELAQRGNGPPGDRSDGEKGKS